MVLSCSLCQITTSRWLNPIERCALSYRTCLMAADPFLFPMYYLLFKTVSDKWGHLHPMRTESATHVFLFFSPWIFMTDTGIFLLNIIFIRYWVCCQNPQVINILRVYIPALLRLCAHATALQRFCPRSAANCSLCCAGCSTVPIAPVHLACVCPGWLLLHPPNPHLQHLQALTLSAARFCCSLCHGITALMPRVFILKAHQIVP